MCGPRIARGNWASVPVDDVDVWLDAEADVATGRYEHLCGDGGGGGGTAYLGYGRSCERILGAVGYAGDARL